MYTHYVLVPNRILTPVDIFVECVWVSLNIVGCIKPQPIALEIELNQLTGHLDDTTLFTHVQREYVIFLML